MFLLFIYRVYVCKIKYGQIKEYSVLINDDWLKTNKQDFYFQLS